MKPECETKKNLIITDSTPQADGYDMPGEYEPHRGCIMIWPQRPGSWIYGAKEAREAFRQVVAAIAESEKVYVAAGKSCIASAREMLLGAGKWQKNVEVFEAETDDAWARDVAPTFVVKRGENFKTIAPAGQSESSEPDRCFDTFRQSEMSRSIRAVNWEFNAWGGLVDGLYADWEKDNAFAMFFAEKYGYDCYDAAPFVLEGGSVHSDGEDTVMVTEACLLSAGRNPGFTKDRIEEKLKSYLGAEKILWLPRGIYGDETNEHVDNVCAFLRPGEVVLAWTDDKKDPQYELSMQCLSYLQGERDARGRKITVHKLPVPAHPVRVTKEELAGYTFEEGEDTREEGERLAASYVNFYFSNEAIVMPVFGGENEESDRRAVEILKELCPGRKVIPVPARAILVGGGNIHCITQQIPR